MAKFILSLYKQSQEELGDAPRFVTSDCLLAKHLFWNGSSMRVLTDREHRTSFKDSEASDIWTLSTTTLPNCAKLFGFEVPMWPPERYVKARRQLGDLEFFYENPEFYMPTKIFWSSLLEFCRSLSEKLNKADLEYWKNYELPSLAFLNQMMTSQMLVEQVKELRDGTDPADKQFSEQCLGVLAGVPLDPIMHSNFVSPQVISAQRTCFTRSNTVTGRATVVSGIPWLTMKKSYRTCFTTCLWSIDEQTPTGKLYTFDYTSLEPRILYYLSQYLDTENLTTPIIGSLPRHTLAHPEVPDIYLKVLDDLGLSGKLPRDLAKQTILSILYGQTEAATAAKLKNHISKPEDFVSAVLDYFRVPLLRQTLARDLLYSNRKQIRSFYGRPINCADTRPSSLLNYYIQATAVDAAILGFRQIQKYINGNIYSGKMFINGYIHDAIVMDRSDSVRSEIPEIEEVGSFGIRGFKGVNFYLRSQDFVVDNSNKDIEEQT